MAKHHYVPRFYYKNFVYSVEEPFVYAMNKEGEISNRRRSVSQIGYEADYNTPEQETEQGRFETAFAPILKRMIETSNPVNIDLYLTFLKFVGFMLGNNIKKRKNMAESISSFELQIEGLDSKHKILIDKDHRGRFDLSLAVANAFYQEFSNWNFTRRGIGNEQKVFITSDDPVSIFNPENLLSSTYLEHEWKEAKIESFGDAVITSEGERGIKAEASFTLERVSVEKDIMMIFPITPSSCLIGFSDNDRYAKFAENTMRRDNISNDLINDLINTITFCYSNEAAYSSSKERLKETMTWLPKVLPM